MKKKLLLLVFAVLVSVTIRGQQSIIGQVEEPQWLPLMECPGFSAFCFPSEKDNLTENDVNIDIIWVIPGLKAATKFQASFSFNKLRIWGLLINGNIQDQAKSGHLPAQTILVEVYDKRPDDPSVVPIKFEFIDVTPLGLLNLSDYSEEPPIEDIVYYFCALDVDFGQYIDIRNGWISFSFPTNNFFFKEETRNLNLFVPFGHYDENYGDEENPETLVDISNVSLSTDISELNLDPKFASILQSLEQFATVNYSNPSAQNTEKNGNEWMPYDYKPFFALASDTAPLPLSAWALLITGGLILVFMVSRFVKK